MQIMQEFSFQIPNVCINVSLCLQADGTSKCSRFIDWHEANCKDNDQTPTSIDYCYRASCDVVQTPKEAVS